MGGDQAGTPGRDQRGSAGLAASKEVESAGFCVDQALLNRAYRAITLIMFISRTAV